MKLELSRISKTIENKVILKDIDLQLLPGQCLALKGSNGSGKTSLIKIMAGLDKNYTGEMSCIDYNLKEDIGYIPQEIVLFEDLTVMDNLKIFSNRVKSREEFKGLLEYFERLFSLADIFHKRLGKLSGGKKRLVNNLAGLFHNPKFVLMDEPTVGLDEETVSRFIELINRLKRDRLMILCSHQEEFLLHTCVDYIRLSNGCIIEKGSYE